MPFDFDLESSSPQPTVPGIVAPSSQEDAVDEFLAQESEADSQISEVSRRLAKAQYYNALLGQELFEGDYSEAAQSITEEIRGFINNRIAVLLGVVADNQVQKAKSDFEEDQIKILKQLANKLLKKPQLMEVPPVVKKAEPPPVPVVKKMQMKPTPPVTAKATGKAKKPPARQPPPKAKPTDETITIDEIVYKKFVDPSQGEIYLDPNGLRYRIGVNAEGKKFMQSISVQVRPTGGIRPLPALTTAQITMVSSQQAAEVTKKMDGVHSALVQKAIDTPSKE